MIFQVDQYFFQLPLNLIILAVELIEILEIYFIFQFLIIFLFIFLLLSLPLFFFLAIFPPNRVTYNDRRKDVLFAAV